MSEAFGQTYETMRVLQICMVMFHTRLQNGGQTAVILILLAGVYAHFVWIKNDKMLKLDVGVIVEDILVSILVIMSSCFNTTIFPVGELMVPKVMINHEV